MKIKYIVFLILFFATGTTYAQTWNPINGKTSFNDSVRYLKYRHSGNLDSVLTISPTTGNLLFVARSAGGGGFGVDSITITPQGMLCAWASGLSTCYPLGAYYDSSALNSDSSYTYHFSRGVFVDSTYLPKSPIFGGTNLVIRDTTVTVNGNPVRGYIFDASGSGGGGSGSGKVYAGLYLLNVNDSTLKVDSSQVAIKDGFFNPTVVPFSNSSGILTQDYGGLGYNGTNLVVGHNNPNVLSGLDINGTRGLIQAYQYGLRFQVGITGNTDQTKEYNFHNANNTIPYLRMHSDLNGYYRHHTVFNTDMQIVGLSTDSTAPAQTGVIKYLTVDKTGIVSYGVAAGGVVTDTTTFNWSVLDSLNTPPVSPATGDVYEVGTAGTGAFSGHNKEIATYNGSSYTFEVPVAGNLLYNAATTSVSKYTTVWVRVGKAIIYNGGQIGYGAVTIGTNDNNSLIFRTNGATRFSIGNSGNIVLNSLAATGNGFTAISTTGLLSRTNFPNTALKYLTGYGTFGSITDSTTTTFDSRDFYGGGTTAAPLRVKSKADSATTFAKQIASIAKNAGRDSVITTLNDGTRYAVKDSVGSGGASITFPNTATKYYNGYGNFGSFLDTARTAISLTTTGSGAASYTTATGVLNIPTPAGGGGQVDSTYFWQQGGNAPTSYANSRIGTLNNRSFSIITAGQIRARYDSLGNYSYGALAATATYPFTITGTFRQQAITAAASEVMLIRNFNNSADIFAVYDDSRVIAAQFNVQGIPSFSRLANDVLTSGYSAGNTSFGVKSLGTTKPYVAIIQTNNGVNSIQSFNTTLGQVRIGGSSTNDSLTLQVPGSLSLGYATAISATNMTNTDQVHTLDCTTGTFTVNLPTALRCLGRVIVIKNSGTGVITIGTTSSQTIDGATTYPLSSQYKYVEVQSTGANWIVIANN